LCNIVSVVGTVSVGINCEVRSAASRSSELSAVSAEVDDCPSQNTGDTSTLDSDTCNTDSLAAELENDSESSTADLLESSSESNDNEADELDMSFTETDNANTCIDDVMHDTVRVTAAAADGPPANTVNTIDVKLAATADVDDDDHRHFISSDRPCSDLKHDAHMSDSILLSHVAMDIN